MRPGRRGNPSGTGGALPADPAEVSVPGAEPGHGVNGPRPVRRTMHGHHCDPSVRQPVEKHCLVAGIGGGKSVTDLSSDVPVPERIRAHVEAEIVEELLLRSKTSSLITEWMPSAPMSKSASNTAPSSRVAVTELRLCRRPQPYGRSPDPPGAARLRGWPIPGQDGGC